MTGAGRLVRLILRRDRVLLPLWVVLLGVIPVSYVASFKGLFPTAASRQEYADVSMHNAGFVALYGRLTGAGIGELVAWRAGFIPVMIALFSLLTVIRHTRADEEAGRSELIGAAPVGRRAQLGAALIVTGAANVVLGAILTAGMLGQGLPVAGSLAFGAEFLLAGWAFAAVGAIAAQLTSSARSARAIAALALGVAWVLRLAGDISAVGSGTLSWLSWLSPIGWVQHIYPYGGDRVWPAVLTVLFTAAAGAAAVVLLGRRDFGSGLLPDRLGPATAAPGLRSASALAWRLHRGLLIGWTVGFTALGLVFGGVADGVADLVRDNDTMAQIFARMGGESALVNTYFASIAGMLGLLAAGYAVQATLRMRVEEATGHAEVVLGTATGRLRWAASHLAFSLLGPTVLLVVAGLVEGVVYRAIGGDVAPTVALGGALAQLPAVWVLAAVALLLFGVLPRLVPAAWGVLAACALMLLVGTTLQFDQWVLDLSPFTHIPHLPGGHASATPLVVLTAVAVALGAAGLYGLRHRDIPAG
ncbi:ABC transporter permease [Krasilnikovia sp. MM14-A1004]|uniref:ABC transporter permease n=1 Tax=Krasilnikovia sp. MM14-A1004 TaxID=3373541 RepID=UPI00399D14FA